MLIVAFLLTFPDAVYCVFLCAFLFQCEANLWIIAYQFRSKALAELSLGRLAQIELFLTCK